MSSDYKLKDIIIIGSGGVGKEVAYFIEEINEYEETWNILGFIDDNSEMWSKKLNGYEVLGGIDYLKSMEVKPYVVIAIANCGVKKKIVESLNDEFEFATIIYPTIKISKYSKVGEGSIIYPGAILTVNIIIGKHVIISGNCGIGHDSIIGDYSTILWGSKLSGYDNLGEEVMVGIGAKIIQNINISSKSKISAGRVVIESI